jgi:response regulator RpfG family c-di-GMP phosphodiesterase
VSQPKKIAATTWRLLIVDRSANIGGLKISLQLGGHEVMLAQSTQEAISLFCGFQPHLVLVNTDSFPGECAALLEKLKEFPQYGKLAFVAVSDQPTGLPNADQVGFDHQIASPIEMPAVLELLATFAKPTPGLRTLRFSRPRR